MRKGESVKTSGKKSGVSEAKTMAALKSHSEAERRRREQINAHLITLRDLVPSNEKAEISTLGSQAKNIFVFMSSGGKNGNVEARELISRVHKALSNIFDKASA
ncbi:transcription factor bHLH30-like [Olea europaea subsp. europaea]|uniref:Transcription factor bHLH30-like n=1 Tax=Olea europaea subsp. europaea TaxID=158383 RepID=A0A8S0U4Q2_OLEEU|nr:transcription factor bHLH30-like [Olea europaea subsp. europaea]